MLGKKITDRDYLRQCVLGEGLALPKKGCQKGPRFPTEHKRWHLWHSQQEFLQHWTLSPQLCVAWLYQFYEIDPQLRKIARNGKKLNKRELVLYEPGFLNQTVVLETIDDEWSLRVFPCGVEKPQRSHLRQILQHLHQIHVLQQCPPNLPKRHFHPHVTI